MSADNEQPQQVNGTAADAAEGKNAEASQTWATMSRWEKYRYLLGHITVEPVLFCYIFPAVLYSLAISNLNLEKACRVNLAYNDTVCDALMERDTDGLEEQDQNVNSLVSQMNIWMVPLQNATPALLILFLGSWSDRRARRKPCIVAPIIGQVITCIGLGLCWFFYYEWPLEAAGVIESLFSSITGGGMVIFMGTMSYVSDVTTPEERTFRLGVINLLLTITSPIANTLSGTLLKPLGYLGIFALTGLIFLVGFLYGALGLKESRPTVPRPADVGFLCDLFNPRSLLDTLVVLTKKRENSRRSRLVLVILVNVLIMGPGRGEDVLSYLYVRERFKWTEVDYSYFTTFGIIINLVGTVLATGVLSRGLGISDSLICLICCVCHVVANFMYAFATVSWVFYLGQVVDIMIGSTLIVARSLSSKLVPPEDFGKVNSLIGLFSALAQVIYMPIFNLFYQYTLTFMSGAFYLLGAALLLPPIGIFLWLYSFERKEAKEEEKATAEEKFQYTTSARYRTGPMVNEAFEDDKL